MAITIDWPTRVINIPRADMTLVQSTPIEIRQLDLNDFRLELKALEADEEGMPYVLTHNHNSTVDVGGITLARVVEITNEYTITFEDGAYVVNLVGGNSNVIDRLNPNNVSVRSSNSAGLVQTQELEQASYDGRVHMDVIDGTVGTVYPTGTERQPVKTLADALLILGIRGLGTIELMGAGTLVIGATDNVDGLIFGSHGAAYNNVTLTAGCSTVNTRFDNLKLIGQPSGFIKAVHCYLYDMTNVDGDFEGCTLKGTLTLADGGEAEFLGCTDGVNPGTCVIDCNSNASVELVVRDFMGGMKVTNKTDTSQAVVGLGAGRLVIDSTCTGGDFLVRGIGSVENNGSASLDQGGVVNIDDIWDEPLEGTYTGRELMRIISAALAGKLSGADTTNVTIRDLNDTKDRIDATVTDAGNRTSVTVDGT